VVIVISSLNGIPSADTFPRVFERLNPKQFEHCFEQWVNQLVQELGIQSSLLMARTRGSYAESGSKALHLSVRGRRNIGWCWHRAKCRISQMKLQPSLPYWCLTLKAVLSPLMPWAKNHRGSDSAGASRHILCLKANHPTLFQQMTPGLRRHALRAPYPYLQNTPRKQGIIARNP